MKTEQEDHCLEKHRGSREAGWYWSLAAQHQSGRETGSGRRQAEWPGGVGESTHPTQGQQGWRHTAKFCNFWQALVLLPHCLLPLKRWDFKATRTTHKKTKNSSKNFPFFFSLNKLEEKDLRETAGRWCQTLAETGACCLHFSGRKKQVKGSENSMLWFSQENKSGQLAITTWGEKPKPHHY